MGKLFNNIEGLATVKGRLLSVSVVLFLVSLVSTVTGFNLPEEVEQETRLLDYEHRGRFDYLVYQKASYLFDDIPLKTEEDTKSPETHEASEVSLGPPTTPKYPIELTDRFDMTFAYRLLPDQYASIPYTSQVEVKAVLQKPDEEPEEVILVPTTELIGNFTLNFSLGASELASSSTTTIIATVYATMETKTGPVFESFTQRLTIKPKGPLLEVDKNLGKTERASFGELNYKQIGEFDYTVNLKPDSPWANITLRPPQPPSPPPPTPPSSPTPPPLSAKILVPGDTIFTNLIEKIDMTFYYRLAPEGQLNQVTADVDITAVLQGGEMWSKTFNLLHAEKSGNFNVSFPLDLFYYLESLEAIRTETGASADPYSLAITANVHTAAETQFGRIDEVFRQTLSTTLQKGTLVWNEGLIKKQPGSIKEVRIIPNPNKYLGLSVGGVRNLSVAAVSIFSLFFLFSLLVYIRFKPLELFPLEKEAIRARKKHEDVIVDVNELPEPEGREVVIPLDSLDELVKAANALMKPVLHKAELEKHTYCVIDEVTRYQYVSLRYKYVSPSE